MAHYAKVLNKVVQKVIVAESDFFNTFVDDSAGSWIQTSYNTRGGVHYQPNSNTPSIDQSLALRKNFAGVGYSYDGIGFYPPKPYDSWLFNSTTYLWDAPVSYPDDGQQYKWDEDTTSWVIV